MKFTLLTCLMVTVIYFRATDKETPDWPGTTQGEYVLDTIKAQI